MSSNSNLVVLEARRKIEDCVLHNSDFKDPNRIKYQKKKIISNFLATFSLKLEFLRINSKLKLKSGLHVKSKTCLVKKSPRVLVSRKNGRIIRTNEIEFRKLSYFLATKFVVLL